MIVKFKNVLWLKRYNNTIFLDRFSGYYWPCSRTQRRKTTNYNYDLKACLLNPCFIIFARFLKWKHSEIKQCIEEKDERRGIGAKILQEEMKKAKLWTCWRQYFGAGNTSQGSKVRQTID